MSFQCNVSLSDEYVIPYMRIKPSEMTAGQFGSLIIKAYLDGHLVIKKGVSVDPRLRGERQ